MKRIICLLFALLILASGCGQKQVNAPTVFTETENGNIISQAGVEYTFLASEGDLRHLGDLVFLGSIVGEDASFEHMGLTIQTGMYAIDGVKDRNILIRKIPNNEWYAIYIKASMPVFDCSLDNCIRLEYVQETQVHSMDPVHATCKKGLTNKYVIATFIADIQSQKTAKEAGLYALTQGGAVSSSAIYGFFAEEPNLAIYMPVWSYDDLAYSVSIGNTNYVLPETWIPLLQGHY